MIIQPPIPDWPLEIMAQKKVLLLENGPPAVEISYARNKAKFEVYGEEMIEKEVKQTGNSGRVYLPPDWVGKHVKIIRND